jgi:cell division protein FtsB
METNFSILEKAGRFASLRAACKALSLSRRKVATGAAGVLALAVAYHVVRGANGLTAFEGKRLETQQLNQQMTVLQQENDRLKDHVQRLQTDPSAIEQQAREQLRYTKPGEIIYSLPAK